MSAEDKVEEAKQEISEKKEVLEQEVSEKKNEFLEKLEEDGVYVPNLPTAVNYAWLIPKQRESERVISSCSWWTIRCRSALDLVSCTAKWSAGEAGQLALQRSCISWICWLKQQSHSELQDRRAEYALHRHHIRLLWSCQFRRSICRTQGRA